MVFAVFYSIMLLFPQFMALSISLQACNCESFPTIFHYKRSFPLECFAIYGICSWFSFKLVLPT